MRIHWRYVYIYVYMYICIYVYMYICIYVYIYIHNVEHLGTMIRYNNMTICTICSYIFLDTIWWGSSVYASLTWSSCILSYFTAIWVCNPLSLHASLDNPESIENDLWWKDLSLWWSCCQWKVNLRLFFDVFIPVALEFLKGPKLTKSSKSELQMMELSYLPPLKTK